MTPEQAQELWTKPYERLVEWNGDTPPITFTHRLIKDFDTMQGWISAQEREIESLRTQLSDALKRAEGAKAERLQAGNKPIASETGLYYWDDDYNDYRPLTALGFEEVDAVKKLRAELAAERERTDWPGTERMELIKRAIKAEHDLSRVTAERDAYAAEADAISSELGGSPVERIVQDVRELQADLARVAQERDRLKKDVYFNTYRCGRCEKTEADLARVTEERNELRHALDEMSKHPDWVRGYAVGANAAQSRIQELERMVGMLRGALLEIKKEYENSAVDPQRGATYKWSLTRIGYALNLTESQAAEVWRVIGETIASAHTAIVTHPADWSADHRLAWVYGIIVGWNDESYAELRARFGWSDETVARLKSYRTALEAVRKPGEPAEG